MAHIAFFGTGLLGSGIIESMLGRGVAVTVWNRSAGKTAPLEALGARVAPTPAAAIAGADRIHLCVSDDRAVDAIVDQLGSLAGATIIDHSTCAPAGVLERAKRLRAAGAGFLHAPVFMSPTNARRRQGIVLASGDRVVFDAVRLELEQLGTSLVWLGEQPELAASVKLLGNAYGIGLVAVLSDMLALSESLGVPYATLTSLLDQFNPITAARARLDRIARDDLDAAFTLTMARKDVRLMLEGAGGTELPILEAVKTRMEAHLAAGNGELDYAVIGRAVSAAPRP